MTDNSQQTPTSSKLPTPGFRCLTQIFFFPTPAYKLWCRDGQVFECQWWLYEVWCVPSASHVPSVRHGRSNVSHSSVFVTVVLQILCIIQTKNTLSQILIFCWPCSSIYLFININQLYALNFITSLFQASTCFEHMCSSSGGQNCITQTLVSSHI